MHTAYIFKAILAELCQYMHEAKNRKPSTPQNYLLHLLSVHNAKYENEFVKYKVPEFVFHMLQKQKQ